MLSKVGKMVTKWLIGLAGIALLLLLPGAIGRPAGITATQAAGTVVRFPVTEDGTASTRRTNPKELRVATTSRETSRSFLKFNVAGLDRPIDRAVLRLDTRQLKGGSIELGSVDPTSWSEATLTLASQPEIGPTAATSQKVSRRITDWDVTSLVTGNGTVSFGLFCSDCQGRFTARERSRNQPELILTLKPVELAPGEIYQPAQVTSIQWQLADLPVDQTVEAELFDIDLFENDAAVVDQLHQKDRRVICYMSVGSWEEFRPDASQFPNEVLGEPLEPPFNDERWLDIRRLDILGPIMEARLDQCREKGFDGVEGDNVDAFTNRSGFPLTAFDQLNYNRFMAEAAHARGLSVGLKNDLEQIPDLISDFDWALNEQCFEFDECDAYQPFINAGKAVFQVEYNLRTSQFCDSANQLNFNSIRKHLDLDAFREACR